MDAVMRGMMVLVAVASVSCDSAPPSPWRALLDGNIPVAVRITDNARSVLSVQGAARLRMLDRAIDMVPPSWNPQASGVPQVVDLDWDERAGSPCVDNNLAAWEQPGLKLRLTLGPAWIFCVTEGKQDLYGQSGCDGAIRHGLLHLLGAATGPGGGHLPQNGRPTHTSGPALCAWHSDCQDPKTMLMPAPWLKEDIDRVCGDGGHGGPCGVKP